MFRFFNLSLKLNGFPIEKGKQQLAEILAIAETEYGQFLDSSKKKIVAFHLENNSFYKDFVGSKTVDHWADLPVMQKKDFQKPLRERLSKGYTENTNYFNKTSGSRGDPFIFAQEHE